MSKKECTFRNVGVVVVAVTLLLILGTGVSTVIFHSVYAQNTITLGEPFFTERGKITSQKEIGPNRTQFTFSANGTLNGNIEVTNTGDIITISKGNNIHFDQGQGIISARGGNETANYTLIAVENIPPEEFVIYRSRSL